MSNLKTNLEQILQEKETKIIPENIKKDVEILGVTGTYEGGSSSDNVAKIFETEEAMQADTNAQEGDLALVYKSEIQNMTANTQTQFITFPETVTLPSAITESYYCMLRAVDTSIMFDGQIMLNANSFGFNGYSNTGMIRISYTSSDGITYTREEFMGDNEELTNPVDLGTYIHCEVVEQWNDNFGYFMQTGANTFEGLYEYSKNNKLSYMLSNKNTKLYIPQFFEVFDSESTASYHEGLGDEYTILKVLTTDENNRVLTGTFLADLSSDVYVDEQKNIIAFRSSTGNYIRYDITVNWDDLKVYYTNRSYISLPDDTVNLDINMENDIVLNRLTIYSDVNKTNIYKNMEEFDYDLEYLNASTQLTTTNDKVYNSIYYGKDGANEGTLTQNVSNSFADVNAEIYYKLQQTYNNMEPRILTDDDKSIDDHIYFILTKPDGTPLLDTSQVTSMRNMFNKCSNLTTIPLLNTSNATTMYGMFDYCSNLTTIPLLDTSSVTNMAYMLRQCSSLTEIPQFNTSKVTVMLEMLSYCSNLTTIPQLNLSSITSSTAMRDTFKKCPKLSNESLNNILASLLTATSLNIANAKTLEHIGLSEEQATICITLSNWAACEAAGWTTGY